jgi:CheY-like chemotaxis protein
VNPSQKSLATGPSSRRSLRILYADDVRELREIARLSFAREGHHVECVDDGDVALARIVAAPDYDLLITDHCMPMMDGLELVTQVRDRNFAGKIIVLSSELSHEVAQAYRKANVDRILYKPIFPSGLRQVLTELFPDSRPAA